jgi:hypothetical protein
LTIHRVSAHTGSGLEPLVAELAFELADDPGAGSRPSPLDAREAFFFARWVESEFGRRGIAALAEHALDAEAFIREAGGFDAAMAAFPPRFRRWLCD